jgi:hypothetical protein
VRCRIPINVEHAIAAWFLGPDRYWEKIDDCYRYGEPTDGSHSWILFARLPLTLD